MKLNSSTFAAILLLAAALGSGCGNKADTNVTANSGGSQSGTTAKGDNSPGSGSGAPTVNADTGAANTAGGSSTATNSGSNGSGAPHGDAAGTGKALTLRFNLAKGRKVQYAISGKTVSESGGPSGKSMTMTQSGVETVEITAKSSNGFKAKTTLSDMKMDMGAMGNKNGQMQNPLARMNGVSFEAAYDSVGNLQDAGGKSASTNPLAGMMGASGAGFMGLVLPDQAVKVGSTWKSKVDLSKMLGALAGAANTSGGIGMTYTLQRFGTGGTAVIGVVMTGKVSVSAPQGSARPGQPTSMDVSVDGTGTITLDAATCELIEQHVVANIGMNIGQMKMSMKQDQTVKRKG